MHIVLRKLKIIWKKDQYIYLLSDGEHVEGPKYVAMAGEQSSKVHTFLSYIYTYM